MTTTGPAAPVAADAPTLAIAVEAAHVAEFAAVPTLRFRSRIDSRGPGPIRAIALNTQIQIAAARRSYDPDSQRRLVELFGLPAQWGRSLRSLGWARSTVQVPAFSGSTVVEIPVPCTYDFEVTAAKYLHALGGGEVPLEFLFSGTLFYTVDGHLQVAQIPWDTEAEFRMPVELWHGVMDRYFPDSAWLRLRRDTFDRLYAYKARHALASWEDAVDGLLRAGGGQPDG
jgi:hypothetical protein